MENQSHQLTESNLVALSLQSHAFNLLHLMDRTDESRIALDRFKNQQEGLKPLEEVSGRKAPRFSLSSEYVRDLDSTRPPLSTSREQSKSEGTFAYTSTPTAFHPKIEHNSFDPTSSRTKLPLYYPNSSNNYPENRSCNWSSSDGKNKRKTEHSLVTPEVRPSQRMKLSIRSFCEDHNTSNAEEKSRATKMESTVSNYCHCNCGNKAERKQTKVEDSFTSSIPTFDSIDLCYEDDDISVWPCDETNSSGHARNSFSFCVED